MAYEHGVSVSAEAMATEARRALLAAGANFADAPTFLKSAPAAEFAAARLVAALR